MHHPVTMPVEPTAAPAAPAVPAFHVGIVATSLAADSRSQLLALEAARRLQRSGTAHTLVDLREFPLPLAGSDAGWADPIARRLRERLAAATHLLFAVPIYNYDVNAAAKNFVELMGKDLLAGKVVGFLCSAGGQGSYMSVMGFANSLMLDFRCWVAPRFLYVTQDFTDANGDVSDPEIDRRIDALLADLRRVSAG